ncbi:MAG: hypothetical protein L0G94_16005 [Brachybacterium sp.]|uniref:hypothetical protein n=1 Tax=Brachybacterium sp. TaxID=1891286 RepID=UPI0026475D78|nr:hypothetical protein [Brachybacterium sp.]MDN5688160.1 hypothetical protein [Brachybacterium sp.]
MSIFGGKDGRGPGGDPSWLGGTDRDGSSGTNWSSDFGAEDSAAQGTSDGGSRTDSDFGGSSDFGGGSDVGDGARSGGDAGTEAPSYQAPRFGDGRGDEANGRGGDQDAGFASSFTGTEESAGGDGSSKGIGAKILGVLGSFVGLIIAVFVAYQVGIDVLWLLIFGAIPLVSRAARAFRGDGRR